MTAMGKSVLVLYSRVGTEEVRQRDVAQPCANNRMDSDRANP